MAEDGKMVYIGAYIPKEIHKKLKECSVESEKLYGFKYTISDVVRAAIKEYFDK